MTSAPGDGATGPSPGAGSASGPPACGPPHPDDGSVAAAGAGPVLVWDLPTRLFHWGLALCFAGSWITAELGLDWTEIHFLFGYGTLSLLAFRVLWGFAGTRYARFGSFLPTPRRVLRELRELGRRTPDPHVGHNPVGALMIFVLLGLFAAQAGTGLFATDDIFYAGPWNGAVSGDLADTLTGWHHRIFPVIQGAVALHVAAIAFHWLWKRQNLLGPMITGRKEAPPRVPGPGHSRLATALVCLALAVLAVTLLVQLAPEPAPLDSF